jgi:hypothetical protein
MFMTLGPVFFATFATFAAAWCYGPDGGPLLSQLQDQHRKNDEIVVGGEQPVLLVRCLRWSSWE